MLHKSYLPETRIYDGLEPKFIHLTRQNINSNNKFFCIRRLILFKFAVVDLDKKNI